MKKVFWTSIVWIVLICGFVLYMRWGNQPLAEKVFSFIAPSFSCPVLQCDVPVCEECNCDVQCPICEENLAQVEPTVCNCPNSEIVVADNTENWETLFAQLDRIETKIG